MHFLIWMNKRDISKTCESESEEKLVGAILKWCILFFFFFLSHDGFAFIASRTNSANLREWEREREGESTKWKQTNKQNTTENTNACLKKIFISRIFMLCSFLFSLSLFSLYYILFCRWCSGRLNMTPKTCQSSTVYNHKRTNLFCFSPFFSSLFFNCYILG